MDEYNFEIGAAFTELKNNLKYLKGAKYVQAYKDMIIGCTGDFVIYKTVSISTQFNGELFTAGDIDLFSKSKATSRVEGPANNGYTFLYEDGYYESNYAFNDPYNANCIFNRMNLAIGEIRRSESGQGIIYESIHEDERFQSILANKADYGESLYIKDNFIMTLFSGILGVNKGDKVDLIIYDCPYNNSFLADFIIKKNSKVQVHNYIRYMHLT